MDTTVKKNRSLTGVRFNCNATTITPLHIGCNDSLTPLGDYVIENGKMHFINTAKFTKLLIDKNKLNEYINQVREIAKTNSNRAGFLRLFSKTQLQTDISDCFQKDKEIEAFVKGNPTELASFIKTNGKPFVPGSSIKGALRTVLLFNWLQSRQKESEDAINNFWDLFEQSYPLKADIVEAHFKNEIEEKFFGKLSEPARLPMSTFKISDSNIIKSRMSVYETERVHLNKKPEGVANLKECLNEQTSFEFNIQIEPYTITQANSYHSIFKSVLQPGGLIRLINQYSLSVLDYETNAIKTEMAQRSELKEYVSRIDGLKQEIEESDGSTAFLRIGSGKMQFYQTMAMIFFDFFDRDENNEQWIRYLNYCNNFNDKGLPDPYPGTRALTTDGQKPLGWTKIKIN